MNLDDNGTITEALPIGHDAGSVDIPSPSSLDGGLRAPCLEDAPAPTVEFTDPLGDQQPEADDAQSADSSNTQLIKETATSMAALEQLADDLVKSDTPHPEVQLCLRVKQLRLPCTVAKIKELLQAAADRQAAQQLRPHQGGESITVKPTDWLLDGLLIRGGLNLVVGAAKVGKTALAMAVVAALKQGDATFLDRPLKGPCPPVLIVGTDQPLADWYSMLGSIGLMEMQPDGKVLIQEPISEFYHSGHPIYLNPNGIEAIAGWCSRHPGGMVILDSAVSLTLNLGISENSREFAKPFANLMKAVSPFETTVVLIHHTAKAVRGFNPTQASRGTSALPALASQLVGLTPYPTPRGALSDPRIVLDARGRSGAPITLVIQRGEGGRWNSYGSFEDVQAEEQQHNVSLTLTDRQALVLSILEERQTITLQKQTTALIKAQLPADFRDPDGRSLRRNLDQLENLGLINVEKVTTPKGVENRYGSKAVQRLIDSGELNDEDLDDPDPNGVEEPLQPPADSTPVGGEGQDPDQDELPEVDEQSAPS